MTCSSCGLALPAEARFCAGCGVRLGPAPARPPRGGRPPVWLVALLWVGAAGTFWIAVFYGVFAMGFVPPQAVATTQDPASLRGAAGLIAVCTASLCLAHGAAAFGLMTGRPWARTFATMVCIVWTLTCVGLPVGLLGIRALWRGRPPRPA